MPRERYEDEDQDREYGRRSSLGSSRSSRYNDDDFDEDRGGPLTTREAGHRGGMRTAQTHGHEFYQDIGRKGGRTVAEEYGPEFYSEIGRKGGRIGGQRVRQLIEEGYQQEGGRGRSSRHSSRSYDEDEY